MSYGIANDPQTEKVIEKYPFIEQLMDSIHGSGIDYDWYASETKNNIRLTNSFHLMDDYGGYYANADFAVVISKKNFRDFTINYTDPQSRYYGEKHMIKDYLYDTVSYQLGEALKGNRKVHKPVKKATKKPAKRIAKREPPAYAWVFNPNSKVNGGSRPLTIYKNDGTQSVIQMKETSPMKGVRTFRPSSF